MVFRTRGHAIHVTMRTFQGEYRTPWWFMWSLAEKSPRSLRQHSVLTGGCMVLASERTPPEDGFIITVRGRLRNLLTGYAHRSGSQPSLTSSLSLSVWARSGYHIYHACANLTFLVLPRGRRPAASVTSPCCSRSFARRPTTAKRQLQRSSAAQVGASARNSKRSGNRSSMGVDEWKLGLPSAEEVILDDTGG